MAKRKNAGGYFYDQLWDYQMSNFLGNKYLVLLSRYILGMVFIVASIEKISMPEIFALSIDAYRVLPMSFVNVFALVIPWLELLCGVFLVAGMFVRSSSVLLFLLLCVFIAAIFSAMVRHLNIDCGCFGATRSSPIGIARVLEDLGLLLLGVHLFFFPKSSFSLGKISFSDNDQTKR
jgi:putative oxidoreductase